VARKFQFALVTVLGITVAAGILIGLIFGVCRYLERTLGMDSPSASVLIILSVIFSLIILVKVFRSGESLYRQHEDNDDSSEL